MGTNKNRVERLEKSLPNNEGELDQPVIVHEANNTRLVDPEERKTMKGEYIRVVVHDRE